MRVKFAIAAVAAGLGVFGSGLLGVLPYYCPVHGVHRPGWVRTQWPLADPVPAVARTPQGGPSDAQVLDGQREEVARKKAERTLREIEAELAALEQQATTRLARMAQADEQLRLFSALRFERSAQIQSSLGSGLILAALILAAGLFRRVP